jgi:hypothetical protein
VSFDAEFVPADFPSNWRRIKTHGLIESKPRDFSSEFSITCSHRVNSPLIHRHRTHLLRPFGRHQHVRTSWIVAISPSESAPRRANLNEEHKLLLVVDESQPTKKALQYAVPSGRGTTEFPNLSGAQPLVAFSPARLVQGLRREPPQSIQVTMDCRRYKNQKRALDRANPVLPQGRVRPAAGEVKIDCSAHLLGCSCSHAVQHALLGKLGKYTED